MTTHFTFTPTTETLQWLAAGRLASRLQRSIRLWILLKSFYGSKINLADNLPQPFNYKEVRSRLFSKTHPISDRLTAKQIAKKCTDQHCICHYSVQQFLEQELSADQITVWQTEIKQLTAWSEEELQKQLKTHPFLTVHRTIRDDLKHLVNMGYLKQAEAGSYRCCDIENWSTPPLTQTENDSLLKLPKKFTGQFLRILESIAFIEPNLEFIIQSIWEKLTTSSTVNFSEPQRRIFIHLNYILSDEDQDRVDTYQQQIEELWQQPEAGVIQFESWVPRKEKKAKLTVYPVCFHYAKRAKYLSAYGIDPDGKLGWHNYRLDRIISDKLTILNWGDPQIPEELHQLWQQQKLPTTDEVEEALEAAWGLNFYLPKDLLIMRFGEWFARWYVNNTERHATFKPIKYKELPRLIQKYANIEEKKELLELVKNRSSKDQYYSAWIRNGDINVIMRLRDWRSNGEVIAPLSLRQRMKQEALKELENY
ncbi:MAG: TIGR03985 family CRISPR-associated protein [Microcoleaceae cyanobacterium]